MTDHSPLDADMIELGRDIQALDFDVPFIVHPNGRMLRASTLIYAPEVFHDEDADITIDGVPMGEHSRWEALTGMTGQHGYRGAVMHSSEFIGSQIAAKLANLAEDEPQTFVVVVVGVLPEDECRHCGRRIELDEDGRWVDPEATGDDSVWRETCDEHDTFTAEHERDEDPEPAGWAILRLKGGDR